VAHHFILDVYVSPNRKYVNLSIIYYIADFSFFMSQDDAYFHIHQNDPPSPFFDLSSSLKVICILSESYSSWFLFFILFVYLSFCPS